MQLTIHENKVLKIFPQVLRVLTGPMDSELSLYVLILLYTRTEQFAGTDCTTGSFCELHVHSSERSDSSMV